MKEIAFNIVEHAFAGKKDKAGMPYIEHLKRVSDAYNAEPLKTIGLLHDLLEDCPEWTEGALRALFPGYIVDAVIILTKKQHQTYYSYIKSVKTNNLARLVKIKDLEDNLLPWRFPLDEKQKVKYESALKDLLNT